MKKQMDNVTRKLLEDVEFTEVQEHPAPGRKGVWGVLVGFWGVWGVWGGFGGWGVLMVLWGFEGLGGFGGLGFEGLGGFGGFWVWVWFGYGFWVVLVGFGWFVGGLWVWGGLRGFGGFWRGFGGFGGLGLGVGWVGGIWGGFGKFGGLGVGGGFGGVLGGRDMVHASGMLVHAHQNHFGSKLAESFTLLEHGSRPRVESPKLNADALPIAPKAVVTQEELRLRFQGLQKHTAQLFRFSALHVFLHVAAFRATYEHCNLDSRMVRFPLRPTFRIARYRKVPVAAKQLERHTVIRGCMPKKPWRV